MNNKDINNLAIYSLIGNNTDYIRKKLNINNCQEFIEYIAKIKCCDINQAKNIILNNNDLMLLMFSIA